MPHASENARNSLIFFVMSSGAHGRAGLIHDLFLDVVQGKM